MFATFFAAALASPESCTKPAPEHSRLANDPAHFGILFLPKPVTLGHNIAVRREDRPLPYSILFASQL